MANSTAVLPTDGTGLITRDPWLAPHADDLRRRYAGLQQLRERISAAAGSVADFACAHTYLGFNRGEHNGQPGVWYREWAPKAIAMSLIGDFNDWDRFTEPLFPDRHGVWSIFLPDAKYADRFRHGGRVKVHIHSAMGPQDRIPAYIRRAVQDTQTQSFCGQYWDPPQPYAWKHPVPVAPPSGTAPESGLRIYEAHVGMATEEQRVGTYREFTTDVLPRIAKAGYNAVQLMAIQEHPYYGSFGYQVSSFYAASSRFGTPEELKELIDTAHGLGLRVLLDLVHSHAVKNIHEGLNHFDGTEYQYFHAGGRGQHPAWDSLLFDYAKWEVLQFLLSNVRFWLDEYRFDGFRFDGVTSMIYLDHGLGSGFGSYADYFPPRTDEDALHYLQLANEVAHTVRPDVLTIAEDVSGLAGMARPVAEGGIGFDYRLAMGIPDYWIKIIKEKRDEDWTLGEIFNTLNNRRAHEKHVAYAESHDQALVGDKTIAFRLMDADMYWHMNNTSRNLIIDRGVALHKMIRLVTFALGGEGYLNFMGNEFGHPEWIDFPREGNGFSYKHARRQWSLVDNPELRYQPLAEFDRVMQGLDATHGLLERPPAYAIHIHEEEKVLVARRGPLIFVFNFHGAHSYADYRLGVPDARDHQLVLDSDQAQFGGFARIAPGQTYVWQTVPWQGQPQSVLLYLPARTALVLAPVAAPQ